MTEEQLILSNLDYYSVDPDNRRCISKPAGCYYSPKRVGKVGISEGCGIGRHVDEETQDAWDNHHVTAINEVLLDPDLREMAPEWMQAMDRSFLVDIQILHDDNHNWDSNGLTASGKDWIDQMTMNHSLDRDQLLKYL